MPFAPAQQQGALPGTHQLGQGPLAAAAGGRGLARGGPYALMGRLGVAGRGGRHGGRHGGRQGLISSAAAAAAAGGGAAGTAMLYPGSSSGLAASSSSDSDFHGRRLNGVWVSNKATTVVRYLIPMPQQKQTCLCAVSWLHDVSSNSSARQLTWHASDMAMSRLHCCVCTRVLLPGPM